MVLHLFQMPGWAQRIGVIQKGTTMSNISKVDQKAIAQVERVLTEMPWLWAIRSGWGSSSPVVIAQANPNIFMDMELPFSYHRVTCYIHTTTQFAQKVQKVEVEVTDTKRMPTMYDVLKQLQEQTGTLLQYVKHMATTVGDETRVYRCKQGDTFEKMFLSAHYRRTRN